MNDAHNFTDPLACDVYRVNGIYSRKLARPLACTNRAFRPIYTLRWYQSASGIAKKIARRAHIMACQRAGLDMPEMVEIGAGLAIQHGWGVVINARAKLGRNVTLLHGVTIGGGSKINEDGGRETGYPVIEDGVTIGPNASIVGGITIGEGARILPGAVIFFDVPPHALVGGNPGKILKQDVPEDIWNKVPFR
ncbi:serine acetyltransferase [Sphingobium sp. D43FB]|uniref:serine O-acetyltransferase n=1 Tax=Sphingobium sp. D43FB TaxID=2017595 RepID=UPI000BB566E0|nr:serine acetyltransferase [Sphingobium sp. D43FB]PBN41626.1 serine acetyltransferase [Sphingobium sp. D43FB]